MVNGFCLLVQCPPLRHDIFVRLRAEVQETLVHSRRNTFCSLRLAFETDQSCFVDTMTMPFLEFSQVKLKCDFKSCCSGLAKLEATGSCDGGVFGLVLVKPSLEGEWVGESIFYEVSKRMKENPTSIYIHLGKSGPCGQGNVVEWSQVVELAALYGVCFDES